MVNAIEYMNNIKKAELCQKAIEFAHEKKLGKKHILYAGAGLGAVVGLYGIYKCCKTNKIKNDCIRKLVKRNNELEQQVLAEQHINAKQANELEYRRKHILKDVPTREELNEKLEPSLGLRIKELRESSGLSREKVSKFIGIPAEILAKIETGNFEDITRGETLKLMNALQNKKFRIFIPKEL